MTIQSCHGLGRGWQFTAFQRQSGFLDRNSRFTGHPHLAKAATIAPKLIGLLNILAGAQQMLTALLLVMTGFGDGPHRTAINTLAACAVNKNKQ